MGKGLDWLYCARVSYAFWVGVVGACGNFGGVRIEVFWHNTVFQRALDFKVRRFAKPAPAAFVDLFVRPRFGAVCGVVEVPLGVFDKQVGESAQKFTPALRRKTIHKLADFGRNVVENLYFDYAFGHLSRFCARSPNRFRGAVCFPSKPF